MPLSTGSAFVACLDPVRSDFQGPKCKTTVVNFFPPSDNTSFPALRSACRAAEIQRSFMVFATRLGEDSMAVLTSAGVMGVAFFVVASAAAFLRNSRASFE